MGAPQTQVVGNIGEAEIFRAVLPPGEYRIGRDPTADIHLDSERVSRSHGQLTLNYFDWLIEDFQSSNGTFVGGKSVNEATLVFPRQEVRVGNVCLEIRRLKATEPDDFPAPQTEAVLRYIPEEMRGSQKYKIHGVIALGGMGAVLEAEDVAMRRRVAMKMVLEAKSAEDIARFVEEAQVTAQLEHPNIIPVYDLNVDELDRPFYTMKLIRGESLGAVLSALREGRETALGRYSLGKFLSILDRVCNAMRYAHSKGVVHRDLKPDNILLGRFGETVVMDWGLSKPLGRSAIHASESSTVVTSKRREDEGMATLAGTAIGTPQYMAPEQALGDSHVDARADVYGMGVLLYCVLTLRPPVTGKNPMEILIRVAQGQIIPPAEAIRGNPPSHLPGGNLPEELVGIAMKALSLDPANRFDSVRTMQVALSACRRSLDVQRGKSEDETAT